MANSIESAEVVRDVVIEALEELKARASGAALQDIDQAIAAIEETEKSKGSNRWVGYAGSFNPIGSLDNIFGKNDSNIDRVDSTLEALDAIITILEIAMKIIAVFQSDFNNLYKALQLALQILIKQIEELMKAMSSTGVYFLAVSPDTNPFNRDYKPGGGFSAYIKKVKHALKNKADPNRPQFFEGDYVGALLIALSAGTNYGNLIKDLKVLSKFSKDLWNSDWYNPPRGVQAISGLFPASDATGPNAAAVTEEAGGGAAQFFLSPKKVGIKVKWGVPEGTSDIAGYRIYRSKEKEGTPVYDEQGNPVISDELGEQGKELREYRDFAFNGGNPITFMPGRRLGTAGLSRQLYEYIDFEVIPGESYYYKIVPVFNDGFDVLVADDLYTGIEGGIFSKVVGATADGCIPDSALNDSIESSDGFIDQVATGKGPHWRNYTLREAFGTDMEKLFLSLVRMLRQMEGLTLTSVDAINEYIDSLRESIASIQELVSLIRLVLASLRSLQFSAAAVALPVPKETGGIDGLIERIDSATIPENLEEIMGDESGLCNIYAGLVVLVGSPGPEHFDKFYKLTEEDKQKLRDAGNFEQYQRAVDNAKKEGSALNDEASKVMDLIRSALGG